jgi:hypothetical protein
MSNVNLGANNISLYPNPPKHYKQFTSPNFLPVPDLTMLNKIGNFMSFGKIYKTDKVNYFRNPVDFNFLKFYKKEKIKGRNIPNSHIFEDNLEAINMDEMFEESIIKGVNIFEAIESELQFIKTTYNQLLLNIKENIEECELDNCLIKYSFQKIYYFISLLKKKQMLYQTIKYFKNEIDLNGKLENLLSLNMERCQQTLQNGLNKVKEDIEATSNFSIK